LTKIGFINTQLQQEENIFPVMPRSGDWPNGARDMHKNAQKVEWKTQSKIPCHYTWLLHRNNCPSRRRFLRSFQTQSKPSRRPITTAKRKGMAKKRIQKSESLKTSVVFSRNFDLGACLSQNLLKWYYDENRTFSIAAILKHKK